MCGIVGVVGAGGSGLDTRLEAACASLGHRGPDGQGTFRDDGIALGHTRLAVIDRTAASDQPMRDAVTGCVLVFNGEIYNYRELREDLERSGMRFRSAGDTEVLLYAFRRWGSGCVDRLNGMFAFAVWDPRRRAVFIARDRLGEKPLHLARRGNEMWFASEIKALLAAGVVEPRTESAELFRFLALADLGHPTRTPFAGVTQLPAGHTGWIERSGAVRTSSYWSPPPSLVAHPGATVPLEQIAGLWEEAVRLRLRSDVPLGTSLSGGADSSTVLATVRRLRPDAELHAFTASFPGTDVDELPHAQRVAQALSVELHPVPLEAGDLPGRLDDVVYANEAPVEAPSVLAQHCVMEEARRAGIVVLLDGQGADEVFAGYDKYAGAHLFDLVALGRLDAARRLQDDWTGAHRRPLHLPFARTAALSAGSLLRRGLTDVRLAMTGQWLSAEYRQAHRGVDPVAGDRVPPVRPGRWSPALRRQDLARVTLPRLLRYGDRVSMAASREVRLPYLDHRLIELAAAIDPAQSFQGGWTKAPLRQLLDRLGLPEVAWRHDKKNFMPPQAQWFEHPDTRELIAEAWASGHRAGVLADPSPVDAILPRWRVLVAWRWTELFTTSW